MLWVPVQQGIAGWATRADVSPLPSFPLLLNPPGGVLSTHARALVGAPWCSTLTKMYSYRSCPWRLSISAVSAGRGQSWLVTRSSIRGPGQTINLCCVPANPWTYNSLNALFFKWAELTLVVHQCTFQMQRHSCPEKKKNWKKEEEEDEKENTASGCIKGENREQEECAREFTVMTAHLFTLAAKLISSFEWLHWCLAERYCQCNDLQ